MNDRQDGGRVDDRQVIELYFARDERAIGETEAKYGKLCLRIARNILSDEGDAEECVNDVYLNVWNAIPPRRPAHFAAFVCKITRNLALKRLRFNTAQKRAAGVLVSLSELEELLPDPCVSTDLGEEPLGRLISAFLRREQAEVRNVFLRRYWYFDSLDDIAERYGFSESKVKSMLYHTRNKLREYLKKEGVCL